MSALSWGILCIGLAVRAGLVFFIEPMLDCDEAPQAYMARLISQGEAWPLVHFQLPYIGALEQYPLALLMLALGDTVVTVNVFYFLLSAGSLVCARLAYVRLLPGGWATLALALFALGHPLVLWMSLQSYSFGGLVFFEALVLWLLLRGGDNGYSRAALAVLGVLNGLALYNNVLFAGVLVLSLLWLWQRREVADRWVFVTGWVVGYAPMLAFNAANDFISFQMMMAKFLGVTRHMVDEQGVVGAIWEGAVNKLTGKGPPAAFYILYDYPRFYLTPSGHAIQSIGVAVIGVACLWSYICRARRVVEAGRNWTSLVRDRDLALYLAMVVLAVPGLGQVRYITVLLLFLPIAFCHGLIALPQRARSLVAPVAAVAIVYLAGSHGIVFAAGDPVDRVDDYGDVVEFLEQQNLRYGYGAYCFQCYAAFTTDGRIKISPQIGPVYLDKIPSFSAEVDRQRDVFYVLPNRGDYLGALARSGVDCRSQVVGNWTVVWDMEERLYPEDLLPETELARVDGFYRWSHRANPAVLNPYRGGH